MLHTRYSPFAAEVISFKRQSLVSRFLTANEEAEDAGRPAGEKVYSNEPQGRTGGQQVKIFGFDNVGLLLAPKMDVGYDALGGPLSPTCRSV